MLCSSFLGGKPVKVLWLPSYEVVASRDACDRRKLQARRCFPWPAALSSAPLSELAVTVRRSRFF